MLSTGVLLFIVGTPRYVIYKPRGDLLANTNDGTGLSILAVGRVLAHCPDSTSHIANGNNLCCARKSYWKRHLAS
jgi:hypothetical protein